MRPFFIVGVKLIGVLVLYWALQHIGPMVSSARLFWIQIPAGNVPPVDPLWNMITYSVSFLVAVAFALFLLFRGERLAALVPLPEFPVGAPTVVSEALLQVGIVVGGLVVACNAVPRFVLDAFVAISTRSSESSVPMYTVYGQSRLGESGIQLVLSWFLVFRSGRVAHFLSGRGGEEPRCEASAEPAAPVDAPKEARP
jgi:hypothetical protein